jgi:hypothetical protein
MKKWAQELNREFSKECPVNTSRSVQLPWLKKEMQIETTEFISPQFEWP